MLDKQTRMERHINSILTPEFSYTKRWRPVFGTLSWNIIGFFFSIYLPLIHRQIFKIPTSKQVKITSLACHIRIHLCTSCSESVIQNKPCSMKVGHYIWDTQYLSEDIRSRAACLPEANPTGCSAIVMDLQIVCVHIKPRFL